MASAKIESEDGPCCPICLEQFSMPRQLPCAHSFCEKCLQSHISTEATKYKELIYVQCPVCRASTSPSIKDRPPREWASLFPVNTVLKSILPRESKVDRFCDACNSDGVSVHAEGFCVVCKEAMCRSCQKFHKKQKMLKDHTILSVEELDCNPENVMKLAEGFTCSEYYGEDIRYYCKNHKVTCCGTCFFHGHKMCSKVVDLKEELPALMCKSKPDEIIAGLNKIEIHLKEFVEVNEACVNNLELQVNKMTDQIKETRNKINSVLDELEKRVKTEGNRLYKEKVIRKQEENHQCLSLIHAVRNSHYHLAAVEKYGSNLQKFITAVKMRSHLHSYCSLVEDKYTKTETMTIEVKFAPAMESIMSLSSVDMGNVAATTSFNTLPLSSLQKPMKDCRVENVDLINLKVPNPDNTPWYTGVTFLPGDRLVLADCSNNQCILLSSSYQFITSHTLIGKPWNICVLDDQVVAVSLYNQNKIQILSVISDVIRPVRMITNQYKCNGIAAAGKEDMVVNGYCGNNKNHWSLINLRGFVKYFYQYDSPLTLTNNSYRYVALNNMKTQVYISVYSMNSLLCFDMEGRKQFTYSPANLRGPSGVAVDRYDNIYVLGCTSDNFHYLSPDGSVIQVITSGVPKAPWAICIHQSKDMLIITNYSDHRKLHIYQLK